MSRFLHVCHSLMRSNSNGHNNYRGYYPQHWAASLTSLPTITDSIFPSSPSGLMPAPGAEERALSPEAERWSPDSRWEWCQWSAPCRQLLIGRSGLMMHLLSICMAIVYFTSSFIQESVPTREICSNINMKAILLPIYGETFFRVPFFVKEIKLKIKFITSINWFQNWIDEVLLILNFGDLIS